MEKRQVAGFQDLDLSKEMMSALAQAGYQEPTPVQAALIPLALKQRDVVGQAHTGTGKTASFVIPILESLPLKPSPKPFAMILVPTRELAVQVEGEVVKLARCQKARCVALYGGKPIRGQIAKLQRGAQVLVGTPGRVLDHIKRRTFDPRDLKIVVLDEADRMLDIGFRPDIEKILRLCPKDRQTLLLSATVPPPIERLARRYMGEPETINLSPKEIAVETIEQSYFTVEHEKKFDLLVKLLERESPKQGIIFCRTKRGTERIYQKLKKKFQHVGCIHGDMQQSARDRAMNGFREAKTRYLVATDVVGRGIDVTNISHIINFDIPTFCDDYIHRVGRTARMGRDGVAFTFVTPEEGIELTRIEIRINRQLKRDEMEGFKPPPPRSADSADAKPAAPERPPGALLSTRSRTKKYRRGL